MNTLCIEIHVPLAIFLYNCLKKYFRLYIDPFHLILYPLGGLGVAFPKKYANEFLSSTSINFNLDSNNPTKMFNLVSSNPSGISNWYNPFGSSELLLFSAGFNSRELG